MCQHLSAMTQRYARKYSIPVNMVTFRTEILLDGAEIPEDTDVCCISGLYLEGARWDPAARALSESRPKELFTELPLVCTDTCLFMTSQMCLRYQAATEETGSKNTYTCPVYITPTRNGSVLFSVC